ncbi:MAG: ketopantoate reductase family protein [Deltaproteobacteria bacterium]|nr:ketopantoate reductase family protein [Deltaproteobacteria bacterium]
MKILVMGTGAVGSFYGGKLARAGHEVIFIARGETLRALQQKGLTVKSYQGDFQLDRVQATDRPDDAGVCDLVLVCVKSYDTTDAARLLHSTVGPDTLLISLQNGVENEELLQQALGTGIILGGMAYIGAAMVSPGVIVHDVAGRIAFGERSGQRTPRVERLERMFLDAGIDADLSAHIDATLWDKLMWNAAFNAICTLSRSTVGEVLADLQTRTLVRETMLEVIAVARAQGIDLQDSRADEHIVSSQTPPMSAFATSMAHDLARRKRLEYEALNGAVVRFGQRFRVPVPLNRTLYRLLARLDPASHSSSLTAGN